MKVPVPLLVNETVPVGAVGLPDVSVTVAVHVVAELTATLAGEHATPVVVGLFPTPSGKVPELAA